MIPDNSIDDEGVKALVPALKSLSQLTSLNLGGEQYKHVCGIFERVHICEMRINLQLSVS